MYKTKLPNGLDIVFLKRPTKTVAIQVSVSVGSNDEPPKVMGMSHFLEHMMFEGTKTRTDKELAEAIEGIGGEMNAATSNERTFYHVKVPTKFFDRGLDILSDMICNSAIDQKHFKKEKKVVLEEIKMTTDQPRHYQFILFIKSLFEKIKAKNPIYGTKKSVRGITREQMLRYYKKYYVPNNMTISIVGNVDRAKALKGIKEKFGVLKKKKLPKKKKIKEPKQQKPKIKKEKREIQQSYVVLGYKTATRNQKDSYALDIIKAIFHKGLSGRIVEEIRNKRGLAYEAGAYHDTEKEFGYFIIYLNTDKKNIPLIKELIFQEIERLQKLKSKELRDAKNYIEGKFLLDHEDNARMADTISFWNFVKDAKDAERYVANIKKVGLADVKRVAKKYLNKNYTMAVLENK